MFNKVTVTVWRKWKDMSQCDIQKCLCHIATFMKVEVILRDWRVLSHSDIHEGCSWILFHLNISEGYVGWQCSPLTTMSLHDMVAVILVGISWNNRFDNEMKICFYENEGWCEIAKFNKLERTIL